VRNVVQNGALVLFLPDSGVWIISNLANNHNQR
jgi:hypothetical protein